ncbi:hypothetical protein Thena_1480 [Thermodesulfobium narugense DSM 14796]|uniref:Uncharacterized protein n=1 Tax=Thermodesulfobium narugense DSM 14796 TaxID=747365 RepID=M1E5H2_9BACT|nr:hypothetical protein [Thermodesulfobium narugense]AEE15092.1 hypothetical protein Thena_1480 [Thermodesulfobium narugense DSM 14796]
MTPDQINKFKHDLIFWEEGINVYIDFLTDKYFGQIDHVLDLCYDDVTEVPYLCVNPDPRLLMDLAKV